MKLLMTLEVEFDITGFASDREGTNAAFRHLVTFASRAAELGLLTPPEPLRIDAHDFEIVAPDPTEKY